jgi:hypothetical protein
MPVADWLADRLAERGDLTAMELAAEVGVLDGDVENWLAGREFPDPDECRRIAEYLGLAPDDVAARCQPEPGDRAPPGRAA